MTNHKRIHRYFRTLARSLGLFFIILLIAYFSYRAMTQPNETGMQPVNDKQPLSGLFAKEPVRTTFLVLGMDEDNTRTDVMIFGCLNTEKQTIDLLSIPRDTYVVMPQDRRDLLQEEDLWTPANGVMKMNQVHHYAGKKHGVSFAVKQIEEMLDCNINYYAKVDLDAFRYIVTAIGGVEFDVPQRMYYRDPEQDLYIDLHPGLQTLTGEQAEGLVRYRKSDINNPLSEGYARGDLQRLEVQQAFVKALISQVLAKENLVDNAMPIANTVIQYVETNFNIADVTKYISQIPKLSSANITTYSLPNTEANINGQSYVTIEEQETQELLDSILYDDVPKRQVSSVGKRIQILNGTNEKGLASKTKTRLEAKGFTITEISDYSGEQEQQTRIQVQKAGWGEDLLSHFQDAVVQEEPNGEFDIVIIVGFSEIE